MSRSKRCTGNSSGMIGTISCDSSRAKPALVHENEFAAVGTVDGDRLGTGVGDGVGDGVGAEVGDVVW